MKRTMFILFVAVAIAPAAAADTQARSVGAHPVVYDDYPESDVVIDVGPDIVLTITGEARTRFEWIENTSDFSGKGVESDFDNEEFDDAYSYAASRYNIGFRVDLPRDVAAVIELQGNFNMGGGVAGAGTELRAQSTQHQRPGVINHQYPGLGRVGSSNNALGIDANAKQLEIIRTLNDVDGDGVFVYQGYIETAHIGDSIFSMRFGRQEMAYGTEWLLGNQDWYDGQTFDGIKGIFEFTDKHRLDLFWAKLAERDTTVPGSVGSPVLDQGGNDSDLFGAYFSAQGLGGSKVGLDAYVMGLRDLGNIGWAVTTDPDGDIVTGEGLFTGGDLNYLEAYWVGVRFFRDVETGFHFSAEGTYLFGGMDGTFNGDDSGFDIRAWGFEGSAGFTWNTPSHPTIKGGITYATGSSASDFESGDWNTFFTPAGEVHPRLGLADLVDASNVIAFNLGYTGSHERHSWGVDLYHFEMDEADPLVEGSLVTEAAVVAGHGLDDELGQELDLWYNYQYSEHMVAQFAVAYFNAGNFIEDANRCAGGFCDPSDPPGADSVHTSDAWRVYANLLVRF